MIYVTGDTHGGIDVKKLSNKRFLANKQLSKNDYVIVAGDFGFVWDGSREDLYWLNWLKEKNFTTLFVDGNHENFDLLNSYPVQNWNGGKVHFINGSVIHLIRGQVFNIDGNKIFTFGGANSSDKEYRKEGKSWWKQEMPSVEEYSEGMENLKKENWTVDYIITHTCPASILQLVNDRFNKTKEITEIHHYFEKVMNQTDYKSWFSGHDHVDTSINEKHRILYQDLIKLE